ncbi:MAG: hypothetical protein KKD16_04885, partial [Proteobacteria bacterium]|nr:hypothetical protein [Pseudomonadota bacterium]MBU4126873.1 hypothetical protein [Pseudomonadota bacterium]MBU4504600.1 hypothetical protein [Pseudomonadota bacterium]
QCFATRGGRGGYACPPSLSLRRGGRGAVAKARVNIFCFLKKLSNTCPLKLLLHRRGAKLEYFILTKHTA